MKRLIVAIGIVALATATTASAQPPTADQHHPPGQTPTPSVQPSPAPAPHAGGMMPMMEMCREMMGPGMMRGQSGDPKMMAEMMEMRGEMMKAMGDIMMKHAKKMQGMPPKAP